MHFYLSKYDINRLISATLMYMFWYIVLRLIGYYADVEKAAFMVRVFIGFNCVLMATEFYAWTQPLNKRTAGHSIWLSVVWLIVRPWYSEEYRQQAREIDLQDDDEDY